MSDYIPEHAEDEQKTYPLLSDKQYDLLKRFQIILLPGLATLYVTAAALFDWPGKEQVTGGAVALATFIGVVLTFAGRSYDKAVETGTALDGTVEVTRTPEGQPDEYAINLTSTPAEIDNKTMLNLRVNEL